MSEAPLVLAVPSKGRLQENAAAYFARAGLKFLQPGGTRDYRGVVQGIDGVEVLFVSASEITGLIGAGKVHLGVTGEDLVRESIADADRIVELLAPLGFGEANVVVAVPKAWIDVSTMVDLDDVAADLHHRNGRRLRVATKYINLTRRFFAKHGVSDYIIVESGGATEGAPAAGTAEIIVDITTTGTTLAANGLKVLEDGVILKSQANLVASLTAPWSARARQAARRILARIAGAEAARELREVQVAVGKARRQTLIDHARQAGATTPFEPAGDKTLLILHCATAMAPALAEQLLEAGAAGVSVRQLDFVFVAENSLYQRLEARLT